MAAVSHFAIHKTIFFSENKPNDTSEFQEYRDYCREFPNVSKIIMFLLSFVLWTVFVLNLIKGIIKSGN